MKPLENLKTVIVLVVICCLSHSLTFSQTISGDRQEIASRLDSALRVSASLILLESDPSTPNYAALHTQLQSSLSSTIGATMPSVVQRLSSQPDWSLTMKLLQLSYGVESVSVDAISSSLGQILLANPSFLAGSIRHLPKQQRALVIQHLKAGWVTVAAAIPATDARRVAAQAALDKLSKPL
jgi:hypothetical protein